MKSVLQFQGLWLVSLNTQAVNCLKVLWLQTFISSVYGLFWCLVCLVLFSNALTQMSHSGSFPVFLPTHSSHKVICSVCSCVVTHVRLFATPQTVATRLRILCLWDFPGKNTGVGCHFLIQGNFPTQGLKPSPESPASGSVLRLHKCTEQCFTTSTTWEAPVCIVSGPY